MARDKVSIKMTKKQQKLEIYKNSENFEKLQSQIVQIYPEILTPILRHSYCLGAKKRTDDGVILYIGSRVPPPHTSQLGAGTSH